VGAPNSHGRLREAANTRRDWRAFRTRHNLGDSFTPYTLRRTLATLLTDKPPAREVSDLLGHSRISPTPTPRSDVKSSLGIPRMSSARSRTPKREFDGSTGRVHGVAGAVTWYFVGRLGLEPRTYRLKVCCSECRIVPGNDG
jgi:hypothetical protein